MGYTHHQALSIAGTTVLSGNVTATGSAKTISATRLSASGTTTLSGNVTVTGTAKTLRATKISATGTIILSGNVSATGTAKTLLATRFNASGTTTLSGNVSATAAGKTLSATRLKATGTTTLSGVVTATATGKLTTLNALTISNTATLNGSFIQNSGGDFRIGSVANSMCGLKAIAAASAGSGVVATNRVRSSSRILLTPIGQTPRVVCANVATIATGTSFTVRLYRLQTAGTIATASGRVAWRIVNK